ncbi:hypothetical protein RIO-1_20 [Pseudoalteromonas phage RIO-1]|uniref:Uncharacterized protein n=1 Tax=Pseudoalteromonas phage RIO-1 TaxID=1316739 RepID=R4JKH7_9CAUD|nr:hypothetical protein RIO-1_20 [Pseudoalteromonas phage RIO-1]AGK87034.1 hypothetical protein RIO-1_20 [Pseudoalteromonas phage RIO-1]
MIEISHPSGYRFEEGAKLPVYLPDYAVDRRTESNLSIKGECLGRFFVEGSTYIFSNGSIRHVPELPLNHVIGIPSLEGKIFEED